MSGIEMDKRVIRIGNSFGVVLPKSALEIVGWKYNDVVTIELYPDKIIIKKWIDGEKAGL